MANLNKVQLIGRLGKDPAKRNAGKSTVTSFSLAINRTWKDEQGVKHEETEWVNVEAWGNLAEVCAQYIKKGSQVYVEGRLKTENYEKDGQKHYSTKVVAESVQFLDKSQAAGGGEDGDGYPQEEPF